MRIDMVILIPSIFSPIDGHADDNVDTASHEGVDERHHEMSLSDDAQCSM